MEFDQFINPDALSNEELAQLYPMLDFIGAWANNMKKFIENKAVQGEVFKGLKLVEGNKGARAWRSEIDAEWYMVAEKGLSEEQRYTRKLISPAQAEKIIGRKNLDDEFKKLFVQSDGKPVLALEDDPRQAYSQVLADEFDD